jgi:hypothetical protein
MQEQNVGVKGSNAKNVVNILGFVRALGLYAKKSPKCGYNLLAYFAHKLKKTHKKLAYFLCFW